MKEIFAALLVNFLSMLGSFSPKLRTLIDSIIDKCMQPVRDLTQKLRQSGHNIIAGLIEGITGMIPNLIQSVTGIADSILQAITAPFQIHSPSRKMAWVGQMIDEGLAEGMEERQSDPIGTMERMAASLLTETAPLPQQIEQQPLFPETSRASYDPAVLERLDRILAAVEQGKIIMLDGDRLVGSTIERIDEALAQRQLAAVRGG